MNEGDSSHADFRFEKQGNTNLGPGSLLLALDTLDTDVHFEKTIVLVCRYNSEGAYGLVLNRFSTMPLSEVFDGLKEFEGKTTLKIHSGGPMASDELQIIQITQNPVSDSFEICKGVYLGGYWNGLEQILASDESSIKLFLGCAGWGKGQLESEVHSGAWKVFNINLLWVLKNSPEILEKSSDQFLAWMQSQPI